MKKIIFLSLILGLFFSCKKEKNKNFDLQTDTILYNNKAQTEINPETESYFDIQGKTVVFFMPSPEKQRKYESYYGTVAQWEFQSMFRNLKNMARSAKSSLPSYGINTFLTYSEKFKIHLDTATVIFDLNKEDQIMGFRMADNNKYQAFYGEPSKKDFVNAVNDFFGIKFKFGYKPVKIIRQDTTTTEAP